MFVCFTFVPSVKKLDLFEETCLIIVALASLGNTIQIELVLMEQRAFKNVNNCLNTNIYSYLETSDGQSSNGVHFFQCQC